MFQGLHVYVAIEGKNQTVIGLNGWGAWGAPFEAQGKAMLRPYMSPADGRGWW